jgi:bacterioferritin-associated ferredoxin
MIVCSCNVLSDREVRRVVTESAAQQLTARQVYRCLGCSARCGRCSGTIKGIIDQALALRIAGCPGTATKPAIFPAAPVAEDRGRRTRAASPSICSRFGRALAPHWMELRFGFRRTVLPEWLAEVARGVDVSEPTHPGRHRPSSCFPGSDRLRGRPERMPPLSEAPNPAPLLRTLLRLRHDFVLIGRAAALPLPIACTPRLGPPLVSVGEAATIFLSGGAAVTGGAANSAVTRSGRTGAARPCRRRCGPCA